MAFLTVIGSAVGCGVLATVLGGTAAAYGQAPHSVEPAMLSMSSAAGVATERASAGIERRYTEVGRLARHSLDARVHTQQPYRVGVHPVHSVDLRAPAAPNHHFYCNTGYTIRTCTEQLKRLQELLASIDLTPLGGWTWILVRSDDWQPILRRVGCDPDSPAFTLLAKRQIFLEEALFNPSPERSRALLEKWRVPLDQLLLFAVTHELGHALCRESDEARTIRYAEELRRTGTVRCACRFATPATTAFRGE
jgi:hypothetical protein